MATSVIASKIVGLPKKMAFSQPPELPIDHLQKNFELKNVVGNLKSTSQKRVYSTPQAVMVDAPIEVILFLYENM